MAESDAGRSATGTVSTEEAERLSERFRPSWEDDPPTVPREAPPAPAPAAAQVTPRAPAPAAAPAAPAARPGPTTTGTIPATAAPGAMQPLADPRRPTLLGISPDVMPPSHGPRGTAGDDLDWELPTQPTPDAAVGTRTDKLPAVTAAAPGPTPAAPAIGTGTLKLPAVAVSAAAPAEAAPAPAPPATDARAAEPDLNFDVEEVAPDSKPSGVGEKYVPKDAGAPPVVLNEDVQVAERRAQAALEAQHRARRAPTIARLKVMELPETLVSPDPFVPPKKGNGRFIALAVGVVVLVAGAALSLGGRGKSSADKAESEHGAVATVAPDTAAPPPPPLPSVAAAPTQQSPAPEASASTAAPAEPPTPAPAAEEKAPEPPPKHVAAASKAAGAAPKPAAAPKAPPAPKTAPAAVKPASKPGGATAKPAGKAVIVRDSPF